MITMNELVDLRMQQHIAHEIYRQQIMQRIPDPFPAMLPVPITRHMMLPPRASLPGVEANLQNNDLWKQFHHIGTEMIITKSGRRMFPSMRLSLSGLEEDTNYCVLLEMVPIGDCRYKFSGSQWVPAGGAEPQSPQRVYLHPDSPASGSHWQAQPILFNKVKLTNNTLDSNGHIVLTSMHKYQPRIHIIRTSDPTQIPWAPQQSFVFHETEFVAVTAYQNDRITKLKIDNNPFAKGFRETGQSRCKRKIGAGTTDGQSSIADSSTGPCNSSTKTKNEVDSYDCESSTNLKRTRSDSSACSVSSLDDSGLSVSEGSSGTSSPATTDDLRNSHPAATTSKSELFFHQIHQNIQSFISPSLVDLACSYFDRTSYSNGLYPPHVGMLPPCNVQQLQRISQSQFYCHEQFNEQLPISSPMPADTAPVVLPSSVKFREDSNEKVPKRANFSISAILGNDC